MRLLSFLLALALTVLSASAEASGGKAKGFNPGLQTIGVHVPDRSLRLDAAVWYPTTRAAREFSLDGWKIAAARWGRIVPGKYPVILISHDTVAGRASVHSLAAYMASRGFIVAAPTHGGDTMEDASAMYRAALLAERPAQMLATLEFLAASAEFRDHLDLDRVGLVGVGAGSATVLQLLGMSPQLEGLEPYCDAAPADPFCTPWAAERIPTFVREFQELQDSYGAMLFSPPAIIPWYLPGQRPPEAPMRPVRFLSSAFLVPGRLSLFRDVPPISVPSLVFTSATDEVYPENPNLELLQTLLAGEVQYHSVEEASHLGLTAPCPEAIRETHSGLCGRDGSDDASLRQKRNVIFADFFARTLGGPLPPEPPAAP